MNRVPTELISEAQARLNEPQSSTSRRRFLQALAAGTIAGATVITLPNAAAASSTEAKTGSSTEELPPSPESTTTTSTTTTTTTSTTTTTVAEPAGEDTDPGGETDPALEVTRVTAGDGTVTLEWQDSSV